MDELWGTFCYLPVEDGLTYLESLGTTNSLTLLIRPYFKAESGVMVPC